MKIITKIVPLNQDAGDLDADIESNPVATFNADGTPRSYMLDMTWDFSAERLLGKGAKTYVSFRTEAIDKVHIPEIQRVVFDYYQTQKDVSVPTLVNAKDYLVKVVLCLGSTNWKLLDQEEKWQDFLEVIKSKKFSWGFIKGMLWIVTLICERHIVDKLRLSKILGCETKIESKQAIAIPENMASKLFNVAIDIVEKYHPHRHAMSDAFKHYNDEYEKYLAEGHRQANYGRWYKVHFGRKYHIPVEGFRHSTYMIASEIQNACMLVLLGFSGVRISEAKSFTQNSYVECKTADIIVPILVGEITKTEVAGQPRQESWVTHPFSKKALELAYDMSGFARDHYHQKYAHHADKDKILRDLESVFLVLDIRHQTVGVVRDGWGFSRFIKKHNLVASAKDVEDFNTINPTRFGDMKEGLCLPKLSPHDFRRTFAVFLVRNKLGSIMTLKHQYKHSNVVMTQWYANNSSLAAFLDLDVDEDLQKIVSLANQEIAAQLLFEVHNSHTLSGIEGRRIDTERKKGLDYNGSVYVSHEECRRMVINGNVSIVEHPTGYCINPNCLRICADDKSSQTCQYEIVTYEKALERLPFYYRIIAKFKVLNDGKYYLASVLTDIKKQIESLEATFRDHCIEFNSLDDMEIHCKSICNDEDKI